jgi:predicted permease
MLENLLTVFWQVVALFLLMAFGFAGEKSGIINENGSKVLSNISLVFVTPCLIINSFNIQYDPSKLRGLLICLAASVLIHTASILGVELATRGTKTAAEKLRVVKFAIVFSNAAYMGIPLQEAVLGADGVFYGSVYVAVFNITLWTYGVVLSTGNIKEISGKKLLLNPGLIGVTIGILLFLLPIDLPKILSQTISSMAVLNTPLAMLIIGFYLAKSNILAALRDKTVYIAAAFKLIVIPLLTLGVMYLCGVRGAPLVAMVTTASAPTAAATSMFATKFDNDVILSVNLVTVSTVFSIITMPVIVALAQYLM